MILFIFKIDIISFILTSQSSKQERIIKLYLNGISVLNILKVMALNRVTVYQIIKKYQTTCRVVADKRSGIKYVILKEEQKMKCKNGLKCTDFKDCQLLSNKDLSAYNCLYNRWILFLEFI